MEIKARYIIISAVGMMLLLVPGLSSPQLSTQTLQKVKQPLAVHNVYFSRISKSVPYRVPDILKEVAPIPGELTSQSRLLAVNKIRQYIALSAIPFVPPARVILKPEAPKSGKSYYAIHQGGNFPDACLWPVYTPSVAEGIPFSWTRKSGFLYFFFNTIPGKTYMVDLSVSYSADNKEPLAGLSGVYSGTATPQNGHIIIGFTANKSGSSLYLENRSTKGGMFFFRCELTQVN
jgi:hypothetical protein